MSDAGNQQFARADGPVHRETSAEADSCVERDSQLRTAQAKHPHSQGTPSKSMPGHAARKAIGVVFEAAGHGAQAVFDPARITACIGDADYSVRMAGQIGSMVKIRVDSDIWVLGTVRDQRQDTRGQTGIFSHIDLVGEGTADPNTGRIVKFGRGVGRYPMPSSHIYPMTSGELHDIYAKDPRTHIEIGTVFPTQDTPAGINVDALLGKHFALVGSTGTGKSTSTALILHRICELAPNGHIVMIDPHGEYAEAFKDTGQILDVSNLHMPYWLMNFEEHCEVFLTSHGADRDIDKDILAKCLLKARSKSRFAEQIPKVTVNSPIPYLLSDLSTILADEMGALEKATTTVPYMRIKSKLEETKADPRYQFMFSGMLVADVMAGFLAKVFRMPGQGKPISIVDVSGVPSDITKTVVAMLSRLVFDFAIWGRGDDTSPVLLVCEEAHRYVPNEKDVDSSVGRILSRIAKEGRKYGISLGLITQRPSDLAEGVLSQCGTIIAMRLNNERDQAFVRAAMPEGGRGLIDNISSLRNRQCIICGEGVAIPMKVDFYDLEPHKCPNSQDPSFVELWAREDDFEGGIARIIDRWRGQGR